MAIGPDRIRIVEDFCGDNASATPRPFEDRDVSASGTPVTGTVAADLNGVYSCAHDNTNEEQHTGLCFGDNLCIDPTKRPVLECRWKVSGLTLSANERVVVGLASANNADPDAVTSSAWFRIEGASNALLWESDDGTTDNDDQACSPAQTMSDDTFVTTRIDMNDLASVKFVVNDVVVGTANMSNLTASNGLQFLGSIEKDSGTTTNSILFDYVVAEWDRA